jgi:polyferredoxin
VKRLRLIFQLSIVAAAAFAGVRYALGKSLVSVETYCPFGGLETAWSFFTRRRFSCAAGETNLALFIALIVLTILARKAFCGWVCPAGALFEWEAKLARRVFKRRDFSGVWPVPAKVDRALKIGLRIAVLGLVLVATWKTGELVFRGYDPYYIVFSAHGHDVKAWSYLVLAALLGLGLVMPMAWCKYLCPLGAALWPASIAGRLRLARNEHHCTGCGACDKNCPQDLPVSRVKELTSGECTLCLECTAACPTPQALELRWSAVPRPKGKR